MRMTTPTDIRIGTAGWSIPRASAFRFDAVGTHLYRYSRQFRCVEINSSFHRSHTEATYSKWRNSTPRNFVFSVKLPRIITHDLKLQGVHQALTSFLAETEGLGNKRGPILVQLPPSLSFDAARVSRFLELLRHFYKGPVVCEPRHATWFSSTVDTLLDSYQISRAAADPPPVPAAAVPSGWQRVAYFRLHGSPRKYWSRYGADYLASLATAIRSLQSAEEAWCVFDNTASGAAIENACELRRRLLPIRPVA